MTNTGNEAVEAEKLLTNPDTVEDHLTVDQWLEVRKESGSRIDPQTADVTWSHEQVLDPYDIYPDLPEECQQVGRAYFARSPESDIWVWFGDLTDEVREKLWKRLNSQAGFSRGSFDLRSYL